MSDYIQSLNHDKAFWWRSNIFNCQFLLHLTVKKVKNFFSTQNDKLFSNSLGLFIILVGKQIVLETTRLTKMRSNMFDFFWRSFLCFWVFLIIIWLNVDTEEELIWFQKLFTSLAITQRCGLKKIFPIRT